MATGLNNQDFRLSADGKRYYVGASDDCYVEYDGTNYIFGTPAGETMLFDDNGIMKLPFQSAFMARLSSTATWVTGDTTEYTIAANSEDEDRNADYNNSTYTLTAPVDSSWIFEGMIRLAGLTASHTDGFVKLNTSNRLFQDNTMSPATARNTANALSLTMSNHAVMDAADTATLSIVISNGTKVVQVQGSASDARTYFAGWMQG